MAEYTSHSGKMNATSLRSVARHAALSSLGLAGRWSGRFERVMTTDAIQFLYLHHIFDDEARLFEAMLKKLGERHVFISYSEAVQRVQKGDIDGSYIALSFDDGFKNCVRAGEIMEELGISGCFFLISSMIGEKRFEVTSEFCERQLNVPPIEFVDWSDVDALMKMGHEIGCHTVTHANLSELSRRGLQEEVGPALETLTRHCGPIPHFSWPYGTFGHFSTEAAKVVFESGFESCASAVRGCHVSPHTGQASALCLRRDHVMPVWPKSHLDYFMARNRTDASGDENLWPSDWRLSIGDVVPGEGAR
jgi:peptidoglycan/xylan/chitin deacetylase (PgdA/CDA1 family)